MKTLINRSSLPGTILFITAMLFSSVALAQTADISISKDAPAIVVAGEEMTYTIVATNNGPDNALDVVVTDALPLGTFYIQGAEPCIEIAGNLTCAVGAIDAGAAFGFDVLVLVNSSVDAGAVLTNAVSVVSEMTDPDDTNNSAEASTDVFREINLVMVKVDDLDPAIAGADIVEYLVTVENLGPSNMTDGSFTDVIDLPLGTNATDIGVELAEATSGVVVGTVAGGFTWTGVNIPEGGDAVMTLKLGIGSGVTEGVMTNVITFDGATDHFNDGDDEAQELTPIVREATWDITKIWDGGSVVATLTCSDGYTDSGSTPLSFTHSAFADGVNCVVTEMVPAGYAPTYSADCDVTGVLSGSTYSCEITNAETLVRFHVTKEFSDGSTDAAEVTLTCDTGLPLTQSLTIAGGDPAGVTFVVTDYVDGTMSCSVTEVTNTPGYDPDTTGCVWDNLMTADSPFSCVVNNTAQDATFTVNKVWEIFSGGGGDAVLETALVTAFCDNEIDGGNFDSLNNRWYISDDLGNGESLTASVNTILGPAHCWAEEIVADSGVESEDDCGLRTIQAGGSSSCTFTNTIFFEGIPTL